jgi:hypothetical protein
MLKAVDLPYNGGSRQDEYVLNILNFKKNGYFLELGSQQPKTINNTYILEKNYDWKGIMVEIDSKYLPLYKAHRSNSIHIIIDATKMNFKNLFQKNNTPKNIDYLQIDLHADNRSSLTVLENLDKQVMDDYKFATVTYEHDCYRGNFFETRIKSREIFAKRGYYPVFYDYGAYEDWYVHPDLVNMEEIKELQQLNEKLYKPDTRGCSRSIMERLTYLDR